MRLIRLHVMADLNIQPRMRSHAPTHRHGGIYMIEMWAAGAGAGDSNQRECLGSQDLRAAEPQECCRGINLLGVPPRGSGHKSDRNLQGKSDRNLQGAPAGVCPLMMMHACDKRVEAAARVVACQRDLTGQRQLQSLTHEMS